MIKKAKHNLESGHVVILNTLFFIAIIAVIIFGLAAPVASGSAATRSFVQSKHSFLYANSAAEEALYRLKNQMDISDSETLLFNEGQATISIADTQDGKQLSIESDANSYLRSISIALSQVTGVSFNYGLQAGKGGFDMSGGAGIYGNVYSNGDILGGGGTFITGSATVANVSDPSPDQSSTGPFPPAYSVQFGGNSTPEDAAQSFQVSTTTPVTSVRFYIKKSSTSWMNNITVRLTNDNGGSPGKSTLASLTLSAQQVTTSFNYISVPFTSTAVLTPGETYWIVFDTSTTWGSYYSLGSSLEGYLNGVAKAGAWKQNNGGTWSDTIPSGQDLYFDLYVGGDTGLINSMSVGSSGGDAWAHEVTNSTVSGTIYCQAGNGNNKACDTSRPDPVEVPFPISEGNIQDWKTQGTNGGTIVGDVTYGGDDTATLGPKKIEGDLYVGSGAILDVTGTLYVVGDVTVSGGAVIRLSSSMQGNSGVIVTDGVVTASGGGQFQGSGAGGSYILVVTTSTCPNSPCSVSSPAVKVSGGTGSVVLNAQQGTIEFVGGASAKQATGHKVIMSGGTTVHYETGLTDINFSSGPSGSWSISSWSEI